ncbi:MAG TPA: type III pantothenate kinase [Dongiaceae bacterium]|nr:type III pantothenate kinase [Dongiaceae bacterium]
MLLAVDVGNSETSFGLFDGKKLLHHWRITSSPQQTRDELFVLLHTLLESRGHHATDVTDLGVSCVVPGLIPAYRELGELMTEKGRTLIIDYRCVPDLEILHLDPATVGADRIVNAVAAAKIYGKPSIVVDLGTATTLDVIGRNGEYVGGVIAPGILTGANALFAKGARLARVEVTPPSRVVGRTTEESMQAGIFFGAVYAVDGLVAAIMKEQEFPKGTPVIATGGLATAVQQASQFITAVNLDLTLEGIRSIYEGFSTN